MIGSSWDKGQSEDWSMGNVRHRDVQKVFESYPAQIRKKLMRLRQLIIDTASETKGVGTVEETLKWGEPSYMTKTGSTIRIGWKASRPNQYAMYFHCRTRLVDTFKELYRAKFEFEGNRAMIFEQEDGIAVDELKHCIALALTYHEVKHLPLLGV